jgi:hypothetical protein
MDLEDTVRRLVRQELEGDMRLSLSHIARRTATDYKRLWSFMQAEKPGRITAAEAQAVYENLTGKPLLPQDQ